MRDLKCSSCGAPLKMHPMYYDSVYYTCEYCGQRYEAQGENIIKIETYSNPVDTLTVKQCVDRDQLMMLGGVMASEMAMRQITRQLADSLAPYIRMETEYDPCTCRNIITASVRVVKSDYRF